jgi:hypothetical protein
VPPPPPPPLFTLPAVVSRRALEEHGPRLRAGAVLLLRRAAVFTPSPSPLPAPGTAAAARKLLLVSAQAIAKLWPPAD